MGFDPQRLKPYQFQFHKGAIRTEEPILDSYKDVYFNSIKVRLELQFLWCVSPNTIANFNSIKVRLERIIVPSGKYISIFQFHKGAIRTCTDFGKWFYFDISIP